MLKNHKYVILSPSASSG